MVAVQARLESVDDEAKVVDSVSATLWWKGRQYRVTIQTITPERAEAILKKNTHNRPVSAHNIKNLLGVLSRGEWMLNGETIVLDPSGVLLQGQHRLIAVCKTGIAIDTVVIQGIDKEAFRTYDRVKPRNVADNLHVGGHANISTLSSTIRAVLRIKHGATFVHFLSPTQSLEAVSDHPGIERYVSMMIGCKFIRAFMPSSFCGALYLWSTLVGEAVADRFFRDVAYGEGLMRGNPAYTLREKFRTRGQGTNFNGDVSLAYMIKAMNSAAAGKTLLALRWNEDEAFPEFVA